MNENDIKKVITKLVFIFPFSARNKDQLNVLMDKYLEYLLLHEVDLRDLSFTLQTAKEEMEERVAIVVADQSMLIENIRKFLNQSGNEDIYVGCKNNGLVINEKSMAEKLLVEKDMHKIASEWVKGMVVDWYQLYDVLPNNRILLPSYPMKQKKHWIDDREEQPVVYLEPAWKESVINESSEKEHDVLLIGTKAQERFMDLFKSIHLSDNITQIYLDKQSLDYLETLPKADTVYLFSGITEELGYEFDYGLYEEHQQYTTLAIIKMLKRMNRNILIKVFTNQCFQVLHTLDEGNNVLSSALSGLCKTITQEYRGVKVIHIDLSMYSIDEIDTETLRQELGYAVHEKYNNEYPVVAYRKKNRYVRLLKKTEISRNGEGFYCRLHGTYLIIGGTGGLGHLVSHFLVRRYGARLIIIGKSRLDDKKKKIVESISCYKGEVDYYQVDLKDTEETNRLLNDIYGTYGKLDGVIHTAAITNNCLLRDMDEKIFRSVVGTQVSSCLFMKDIYNKFGVQNFIVFSSASSFFGNAGGGNYNASNSFKDAFTLFFGKKNNLNIKLINWGLWDVGLGKEDQKVLLSKRKEILPIKQTEGLRAFDDIINADNKQVFAITANSGFLKRETEYYGPKINLLMDNKSSKQCNQENQVENSFESILKTVIGNNLKIEPVSLNTNVHLGDYGLDSIISADILSDLEGIFGELPSTLFYEQFTVSSICDYLKNNNYTQNTLHCDANLAEQEDVGKSNHEVLYIKAAEDTMKEDDIAIIGLSGQYPGARNLSEFWDMIINGSNSISEIPSNRWDYKQYKDNDSIYCIWGGFLSDYDSFDSMLFNISPKEAKAIDPQERLMLQTAYNTFTDAGYSKEILSNENVGVFIGVTNNTYELIGVENWRKSITTRIPSSQSWSIANRISYALNLKGPSMPIDTACSSSLSAIHYACESIHRGESKMALAGGVNLYLHPYKYAGLCQMKMLSPTGQCSAFGQEADGFVPGEGVGAILLKPLLKAINDHDNIYGVIKATAVNHGGKTNGYTVPNPCAQAELIIEALRKGNVDARSISYVEAHGTGTILGDPIEIIGLTTAFRDYTHDKQFCSIGSIKPNIGHLEAASGIAGVTKVLLQMKNKKIAPSINYKPVNSKINFSESPFFIQDSMTDWEKPALIKDGKRIIFPRRASISSFGAGGSNAHLIIEEPLEHDSINYESEEIIPISVKKMHQVRAFADELLIMIKDKKKNSESNFTLRNLAFTLQCRDELEERLAIVTSSLEGLEMKLEAFLDGCEEDEGVYFGVVQCEVTNNEILTPDRDNNLREIAYQWVCGKKINWKDMYGVQLPYKITLPSYPYIEKKLNMSVVQHKSNQSNTIEHPMLREKICEENRIIFIAYLGNEDYFLREHRVAQKELLPAAGFIEMIMKACTIVYDNNNFAIQEITFLKPLSLDSQSKRIEVHIEKKSICSSFSIKSCEENEEIVYVKGQITQVNPLNKNSSEINIIFQNAKVYDKKRIYDFYKKIGIEYGPSFQCLKQITVDKHCLMAELDIYKKEENYVLPPSLLDGVLQSIVGFALDQAEHSILSIPYFIGSVQVINREINWKYVYVTEKSDSTYFIRVTDELDRTYVVIEDFIIRPVLTAERHTNINGSKKILSNNKNISQSLLNSLKIIVSEILELDMEDIDDEGRLGEYGFDSLTFTELAKQINHNYNVSVSPSIFFEFNTLTELSSYLQTEYDIGLEPLGGAQEFDRAAEKHESVTDSKSYKERKAEYPVAIIGLDGIMPQSDNIYDFWSQLINGRDLISEVPISRWDWKEYYGDSIKEKNKTKAKWGGFIPDVDTFDARFFHIATREAELMDPQQRKMLELTWNVIENAGYSMTALSDTNTGVFIGVAANTEYNNLLSENMTETEVYHSTGVATSMLVNRISYMFNWHGPSEPVDTACSSSLVAIHRAIESMKSGDCDMALAGGVNIILTPKGAISFGKSGMLSLDGKCKTFDKCADGYVRSEGMGAVLLKPLEKAEADGDHIYGVILSSSINHGGRANSITSPNTKEQVDVLVKAYNKACVDIDTIDYIETHGTGTQLGDPIEVNALKKAFALLQEQQNGVILQANSCGLGAVKTNVGHLETAAGMAGLFKVLFSFRYKQIPANINFSELNPNISLSNSPFYLIENKISLLNKKNNLPIRAGISSFGFGGVNAHIVLEEYKSLIKEHATDGGSYLIILSAKDKNRLLTRAKNLKDYLLSNENLFIQKESTLNVQKKVIDFIADYANLSIEEVIPDLPLVDMGFDGIMIEQLLAYIIKEYGRDFSLNKSNELISITDICEAIKKSQGFVCDGPIKYTLKSLAFTLQVGREEMEERVCWVVNCVEELITYINDFSEQGIAPFYNRMKKTDNIDYEMMNDAIENRNLKLLAQCWIDGAKIDWQKLYGNERVIRLELPGYPFYKDSYWFINRESLEPKIKKDFIEVKISDKQEFQYMIELVHLKDLLADHKVKGKITVPGTLYFEILHRVIQYNFGAEMSYTISKLFWISQYILEEVEENLIYINIQENKNNEFKIICSKGDTECLQAQINFNNESIPQKKISLEEIKKKTKYRFNKRDIYSQMSKIGLDYGLHFQVIDELYGSKVEAIARLKTSYNSYIEFFLPPNIIDGAFQAIIGLDKSFKGEDEIEPYIPFSLKALKIFDKIPKECYAYVQEVSSYDKFREYDIYLLNLAGDVLAEVLGLGIKEIPRNLNEIGYFTPYFMPSPILQDSNANIPLVFINSNHESFIHKDTDIFTLVPADVYFKHSYNNYCINLLDEHDVKEVFQEIVRDKINEFDLVIHLSSLKDHEEKYDTFFKIFNITKVLVNDFFHVKVNLLFYTYEIQNNLYEKAIISYARTLCLENPQFSFTYIELEHKNDDLLNKEITQLSLNSGCHEIQYSDGIRYKKYIKKIDINPTKHRIRQNGTYIISGGAGGLAQALSKYLLNKYNATIILLCRKQADSSLLDEHKPYKKGGGKILTYKVDISDIEELSKCITDIEEKDMDIHGVFHLAGKLNDSYIMRKAKQGIIPVFDSKIKGIENLDMVTKKMPLDFFCAFSSLTSVIGNKGQSDYAYANRYMDEFINLRCSQVENGLRSGHSCVINWPLWENGGMNLNETQKNKISSEYGIEVIQETQGLHVLEKILDSDYSHILPIHGNIGKVCEILQEMDIYLPKDKDVECNKLIQDSRQILKPNQIQEQLLVMFSQTLKIDSSEIDVEEDLDTYGFDSLMMVEILRKLEDMYGLSMDPSIINQSKNIKKLGYYLFEKMDSSSFCESIKEKDEINNNYTDFNRNISSNNRDIAVIGMACRFPKANDLNEYWNNLYNEKKVVTIVPQERWDINKYYSPDRTVKNTTYSKWGSFIDNIYSFDASYWGIPDEVALVMDPQHRILLELVEALWCNSGYVKEEIKGKNIGVFIGAAESSYIKKNLDKIPENSMKHIVVNSLQNMMAARVSDTYDLCGPSLTLDTACSSSMVAIHEACEHIKNGECDMAIAGGIQLLLDPIDHIGMSKAGVLSEDSNVYVFDERANGIIIGEGAGVVLLKPLDKALRDGDIIKAIIKGSAVNNDGHTMGITTPNIEGQKTVIRKAIENSNIEPGTISYYEAHGTGTLLGDPIEIRAATQIYKEFSDKVGICGVGSVKGNMGHLLRASGIASFIKVVLSLQKETVLRTINCEKPHARFNFSESPFYPVRESKQWDKVDGYRRAAISSFGFGGTNCHMILEQFDSNNYMQYTIKRETRTIPKYNKKVYWLGHEIMDKNHIEYLNILKKLYSGDITLEEAFLLEKKIGKE